MTTYPTNFLPPSHATAQLIDGKAIAAHLNELTAAKAAECFKRYGSKPGLAVILVGDNPASQVYVRNKSKTAIACGFHSIQHDLPLETSEGALLQLIETLNKDPTIHGILVQLPLPKHINSLRVLEAVSPRKDVDGFHPINVGHLVSGNMDHTLVPCTPAGALYMLHATAAEIGFELSGARALVVGRSNIVGKPMAHLLLQENCTVTIAHSRSQNLPALVAEADILVAAVGQPEMIKGEWVKPGAIVIDVGINRVSHPNDPTKTKLVGDVAFMSATQRAKAITPVPGGVGPMTIAMLMHNTMIATQRIMGIEL